MNKTILVVDDEKDIVLMLAGALRRAGFLVLEAVNGIDALALLEHASCDLVLSDFQMPDINGLELAQRILSGRPNLPVILMSGNLSVRETIRERGFDCIQKPFLLPDLIQQIKERISSDSSGPRDCLTESTISG